MITIERTVIDLMTLAAERSAPRECCGLLFGVGKRITRAVPIRNLAAAPGGFETDALGMAVAERAVRAEGLRLMGYYHSHPDGDLEPSEDDRRGDVFHDLPPYLHLIFGLNVGWVLYDKRDGAWRRQDVQVTPTSV